MPDLEAQETAPLLVPPPLAKRKSTGRSPEEAHSAWWNLTLGAIGLTLLFAIASGLYASFAPGPSKPSDTPDFTKLPGPQPGLRNPNYLRTGYNGAVASEVDLCSEVAVQVLREGGTATDAGIATTLCIGTTNMFSSGIGGGGFLVIKPSTTHKNPNPLCREPISIDFRETAPGSAYAHMFSPRPLDPSFDPARASRVGGLSIGVPGEIRGLEAAYKACGGGVSWARLFQPAANIARKSPLGPELARRLRIDYFSGWMMEDPLWKKIFAPNGTFLNTGEVLRRETYAVTLETIGREGADAFYSGKIADALVATIKHAGGNLTHHDLASYKANVLPALRGTYLNRTIYTSHAPSGGPVLINLLNTIEGYETYVTGGRTGLAIHRFVEALKFAFAARTELGDPAFIKNSKKLQQIMTKSYAAEIRANITDDRTHNISYYAPHFDVKEDHGTTHLSVIDRNGSAISITSTVNLLFGSRVMDPSTGIILNDEMDDFATPNVPDAFGLRPSPYNYPAAGKRPLSSTSPLVMDDEAGRTYLALGGSGGSRIFGAVAQVILNLDWGYDVANAIEQPRVHDQLSPAYVSIESGYPPDLIEALKSRGHNITLFDVNLAIAECQAVVRNSEGHFFASSDSRKHGIPAAY